MKIPGVSKLLTAIRKAAGALTPIYNRGSWWPTIREPYSGAWQRNDEWTTDTVLAYHAVYACITLIANDIGKLRTKLVRLDDDGIWSETTSPAFSPVLKKPNRYQNHIQFKQWWITSKLIRGNSYALKERDARGVVVRLYLLDPQRVTVLVAPDGGVYYQLNKDELGGSSLSTESITVPASEIIHDRMNCLFHPLMGVSPLYASGMAASGGLKIQSDSKVFFANGARPSGVLLAPEAISDETARELKEYWQANFTGDNAGKIAVLGDNLKFEPMRMSAVDAQLIEQLEWTAKVVCSTFHVPPFKIGIDALPAGQKVGDMNQIYYSDCLQSLIEEFEACMDEGLGLDSPKDGVQMGVELDLENLLRMDPATQAETLTKLVTNAISTPNEARRQINRKPLVGGDTVYMQQQDYPLDQVRLNKIAPPAPPAPPAPVPQPNAEELSAEETRQFLSRVRTKAFQCAQT